MFASKGTGMCYSLLKEKEKHGETEGVATTATSVVRVGSSMRSGCRLVGRFSGSKTSEVLLVSGDAVTIVESYTGVDRLCLLPPSFFTSLVCST